MEQTHKNKTKQVKIQHDKNKTKDTYYYKKCKKAPFLKYKVYKLSKNILEFKKQTVNLDSFFMPQVLTCKMRIKKWVNRIISFCT